METVSRGTYYLLSKHPFVEMVFDNGMRISQELGNSKILKTEAVYEREPLEDEFYCLQVSFQLAHLLTAFCKYCQHCGLNRVSCCSPAWPYYKNLRPLVISD